MKEYEHDSTVVKIPCITRGKQFKKRADEGASKCYKCYKKALDLAESAL